MEGLSMNAILLRICLAAFFFTQLTMSGLAQSGIITTYAGPAMPANGTLATIHAIDYPTSVTPDGRGGFYMTSSGQNRVYRVAADGSLRLVAGSGALGYSGDGGSATAAMLNYPIGVAIDSAGNIFIADTGNNRIRKVTPDGIITTVAGNGNNGFGGDGGQATAAQLSSPYYVAVDSAGNLYFNDNFNQRIRKVTGAGVISTVAGNGSRGFGGDGGKATAAFLDAPNGVAVDSTGNLFIADTNNCRIRKVTVTGVISTIAGNGTSGFSSDGGQATAAQLSYPIDVALDSAGNLFIADRANQRIRKVTVAGVISTVVGNGTNGFSGDGGQATAAQLNWPTAVAIDFVGNLFIADSENDRIRKVTVAGVTSTVAGNGTRGFNGDGGQATAAQLYYPNGVAIDSSGNLYIADSRNNRIRKVTVAGVISTVAGNGIGGFGGDGGQAASAALNGPNAVAVDSTGNLYIADSYNNRIRKLSPAGVITTVAGNGTQGFSGDGGQATAAQLNYPSGMAVDSAGNIFISDRENHRIRRVSVAGVISTIAGNGARGFSGDGGLATLAQLSYPSGMAFDSTGNLYIAVSDRIRKVTVAGVISTVAGNGNAGFSGDGGQATAAILWAPNGVAFDSADNLYIADSGNNRIRKVTASGTISTIAGNGNAGFSGDGGLATSAQLGGSGSSSLYHLNGVAVDSAGALYIADTGNNRIRKIYDGSRVSMNLTSGSTATSGTLGLNGMAQSGYAILTVKSGTAPYGTAVFSYEQNGITVSEAGVPASPPTTSARIFIDYRSGVLGVPGRLDSGTVNINTGIGIVNHGSDIAHINYTLFDINGKSIATGGGTLAVGYHLAKFINQLNDVASGFVLPANFQFGALSIVSDQPLSVTALRMTANQRGEPLFTTTPVADGNQPLANTPVYFPQLADGSGWTTSLILLNTSSSIEKGSLNIFDNNGLPLVVHPVGGTAASSFPYSIPAGGAFRLQTDGSSADQKAGWVQLVPDNASSAPIGSGVFGYNPVNILTTESGIPSALSTTHARIFVDLTSNHNTGLAIAHLNASSANVAIKAFQTDGVTPASASQGSIPLAGLGHDAKFVTQLISGLSAAFTGVLDISSPDPFAAITVRSLTNERGDFLLTTFPIADATRAAPSPIVFPHIADGGGYSTQFILISPTGTASTALNFYGEDGKPLAVAK
jgi:trimeric autotransporter adhesin